MPPRIAATYTGPRGDDGLPLRFLEGIPARDLTEDEFAALPDDAKIRLAENASSKDHAIYRLKPKEAEAVAEIELPAPAPEVGVPAATPVSGIVVDPSPDLTGRRGK